jgi:hypothetical protein
MTELESKIWDMTHRWCDAQYGAIPDQNRRYLMDEIKALVLSNVSNSATQVKSSGDFRDDDNRESQAEYFGRK